MIEKLSVKNFSVFRGAEFAFAKGINVVIGSNSTGKSHLLKLAYTAARWSNEMALRENKSRIRPDKATLQKELANKLMGVYRCDGLGRLSTRGQGVQRTEVGVRFYAEHKADFSFRFSTKSTTDAVLEKSPETFLAGEVVFFPTKEMLTMYPGFAALYRSNALQIDETYYDLCLALEKPLPRGPKLQEVRPMLDGIEAILHGSILLQNDRFYLIQGGGGRIEMPLVAEGFRKLSAVAYLLANGTLAQQSILFWDEPETNLNPAYIVKLVELLIAIASNATQVFLATHSLFLLREFSLQLALTKNRDVKGKFFSLAVADGERSIQITEGNAAEDIEPIVSLDAEIEQSQRYLLNQTEPVGR